MKRFQSIGVLLSAITGLLVVLLVSVFAYSAKEAYDRRAAAVRQWQRLQGRFPALLSSYEPVVSRVRTPIGRRGIYAVRIGADSRGAADAICRKLHGAGGSCVVRKNR